MADVRTRSAWYQTLQRLEITVAAIDRDTVTAEQVKAHLSNGERIWRKIDEAHSKILAVVVDDDGIKLQQEALEPIEDCYTKIQTMLFGLQEKAKVVRQNTNMKLPDMSLPTFDGKYEEWPTFQDLFLATVDKNISLSGSQKLQYLKTCTKGEAASLVKSFPITDANYREAWQLLEDQYDNQREIVHSHIKRLINQPAIKAESASSLQNMLTITMESLRSLKVMGRPTEHWDDLITVIIIEKFDGETKAEWAKSLRGSHPPTLKELQDFINQHVRTLHAKGSLKQTAFKQQANQNNHSSKRMNTHHTSVNSVQCAHCKGNHLIYQCTKLKDMDMDKRYSAVRATGVCLNCLVSGHTVKDCQASGTCKKCGKKHNTFLHMDHQSKKTNNIQQQLTDKSSNNQDGEASSSAHSMRINTTAFSQDSPTLLKTAIVDILDSTSAKTSVRVFIDDGGEGCLIKEATMNLLGLRKEKANVTVVGVGDKKVMKSKWKTRVRLYSQVNNSSIEVELYAVPQVTGVINKLRKGDPRHWSHIANLQLADPYFYEKREVDILLGSNIAPYLLKKGLKILDLNSPVAQETIFGWVLTGNVGSAPQKSFSIHNFKCEVSELLQRFWKLEELPDGHALTPEEETVEKHFIETHTRQADGRYVVRLPFNEKKHLLGDSRDQAYRRLLSLEKRFLREPKYKQAYVDFMNEYKQLGHMEKVIDPVNTVTNTFYLPHHFVLKEESTTTKQRTVFDGSAKSTTGYSLNDILMVGATVQPDIFTIILKLCYFLFAVKADFEKFYRQYLVHEEDRDYQRILWREDSSLEIEEYRLCTATYGTGPAAFLATRSLNQLAQDEKVNFPAAAEAIKESTYVDDFLGSWETREEVLELINQMIAISAKGGLKLRKWCSNDPVILQAIPEELREQNSIADFEDTNSSNIKALGIKWDISTDEFIFTVNIDTSKQVTKRNILSEISKTFDPIGWLAPVTIKAKLLMQKIWIEGTDWDSELSASLKEEWNEHVRNVLQVTDIRIPRCIITSSPLKIELHGFSDSSELSYCSAIYLKCVYQDGSVSVRLLTSRTRVAPIKSTSLPKLELCGASLLAEHIDAVRKTIKFNYELFCWTDSTITLRWISAHSRRWKTFVANRVAIIQTLVPPEHWHHVKGEHNPADLPTRGITTEQLVSSDLWWHGPTWLKSSSYPLSTQQCNEDDVKKEERSKKLACFHLTSTSTHSNLFNAFSSLEKLCRCTAYLQRFILFLQSKKKSIIKGSVTIQEINRAKQKLTMWAQSVSFPEEIHHLQKHDSVKTSSKLLQLTPFLDINGIMRVGGRIQKSELPETSRHPIILPNNHQLTQLIIHEIHHVHLHSGFTLTHAALRRKYWITRARDTIRHLIRRCITCRRTKATTASQLMGSLPLGRVTATRPFLHAGVDFAGPFQIKYKKGRHFIVDKAYFAIFVCLSTKAIHLEAVTSLSTEAFIACYERFVSRRGRSAHLYSDCGTNFVGADKVLQQYFMSEQSRLQHQFTSHGTNWNFNPPASPHQGGLWEAGVKCVKYHFHRVVGQYVLQLEQFQTLLCKIEACLNSRPLCPLSSDPNDLEALTPGHFLIGEAITNIPEPDVAAIKINRLEHWQVVRQMTQHFWQRWTNEYLT